MSARKTRTASDAVPADIGAERILLGLLLHEPGLLHEKCLAIDYFSASFHHKVYRAMNELIAGGKSIELLALKDQAKLTDREFAELSDLSDSAIRGRDPDYYVERLRSVAGKRNAFHLAEELSRAARNGEACAELARQFTAAGEQLMEYAPSVADGWRGIFHSHDELLKAPPLRFAISGFLQEAGITLVGGLSGHGKTLVMLSMVRALLEQTPLFGYEAFRVTAPATRVLYLIPESSIGPFGSRIRLFRMEEHVRADRLLVRTLSSKERVALTDPRILKAADGADVFLDTAVRFMDGQENDTEAGRAFADVLFRLLAAGARTITGAHHSPKSFETQDRMTLENILRGTGDIGAMLCTAWGLRQIDPEQNRMYMQNVKPRDFQPCEPFIIQARPYLDETGQIAMIDPPGTAGELRKHLHRKGGRPVKPGKKEMLDTVLGMRQKGASLQEMADAVGMSKSGVRNWLDKYDAGVH